MNRVGVYGASGSGKSTWVKAAIRGQSRVVVFDPLDEYGRHRLARVDSLKALRAVMARNWRGFRVAYVPRPGQEARSLSDLCRFIIAAQEPGRQAGRPVPLTLVVEEMNLSFPVTGLPAELDGMMHMCSRGRHYGVRVIGVTQRVAEVATRFRGNTDARIIFRQGDHRDVSTVCSMIGPAWRPRLMALETHCYLEECGGKVTLKKNSLRG